MAGTKGNRRVLYTKKIIKESLIELLQDNEIHEITVTDICKKADINRGTFYTHYKDAYDLLQSIEDGLFDQIMKYVMETPIEIISQNRSLCKILFCKQRGSKILDRILYIAHKINLDKVIRNSNVDEVYLDYLIRYSIGGILSIIQTWLENDLKESPDDLVNFLNNVVNYKHQLKN